MDQQKGHQSQSMSNPAIVAPSALDEMLKTSECGFVPQFRCLPRWTKWCQEDLHRDLDWWKDLDLYKFKERVNYMIYIHHELHNRSIPHEVGYNMFNLCYPRFFHNFMELIQHLGKSSDWTERTPNFEDAFDNHFSTESDNILGWVN